MAGGESRGRGGWRPSRAAAAAAAPGGRAPRLRRQREAWRGVRRPASHRRPPPQAPPGPARLRRPAAPGLGRARAAARDCLPKARAPGTLPTCPAVSTGGRPLCRRGFEGHPKPGWWLEFLIFARKFLKMRLCKANAIGNWVRRVFGWFVLFCFSQLLGSAYLPRRFLCIRRQGASCQYFGLLVSCRHWTLLKTRCVGQS